jgi:Family of unknown function (DUF6624)
MRIELATKLKLLAEEDQRVLQQLFEFGELPSEEYHPIMKEVHETNTAVLKEIIDRDGWLGISLVGKEAAKSAWLIVQHSVSDPQFMSSCVQLLEKAVVINEAEGWQLAFLQDRIHILSGREQVYGTQFDLDADGWPTPFPITDPDGVDARRKALGLNSLGDRLQEMREREQLRRDQQV